MSTANTDGTESQPRKADATQQIVREARDEVRTYFNKPFYLPKPIDEEDKVYVIIFSAIERVREVWLIEQDEHLKTGAVAPAQPQPSQGSPASYFDPQKAAYSQPLEGKALKLRKAQGSPASGERSEPRTKCPTCGQVIPLHTELQRSEPRGQQQEWTPLLQQVGLDIRVYAHDDLSCWKYLVRLCDSEQSARLHTPRFVEAVNKEVDRRINAELAAVKKPASSAALYDAFEALAAERQCNKRDGKWLDEMGACKVCDGEIPHGHTNNCDIWKLEQQLAVAIGKRLELCAQAVKDVDALNASHDALEKQLSAERQRREQWENDYKQADIRHHIAWRKLEQQYLSALAAILRFRDRTLALAKVVRKTPSRTEDGK